MENMFLINAITFLLSFTGGWIVGYLIAFLKKKRNKKEIPLLTPEEKEIYKLLKKQYKELQQAIKEVEDKLA
jgi:hypothetical protein